MKKIVIVVLIFLVGCSTTHYITYEGAPEKNVYTFYTNGIPITSYQNDSSFVLLSAKEDYLFGKPYLRLWLLYQNNSITPYLLEPYDFVKLVGKYKEETFNYYPQSPTEILDAIDQEKNIALIVQSIGGALKAITTEGTIIKSNTGEEYRINDKDEKRNEVIDRTNYNLYNTASWYNIFENSFNNGVLRKNTIFPHHSVNGYLYFPLPEINGSKDWSTYNNYSIKDLNFEVILITGSHEKSIGLLPTKIW